MTILVVLLNCIYSNIILAPTLPESLSKYLVQSRYTPTELDRQKIRVQLALPTKVCICGFILWKL